MKKISTDEYEHLTKKIERAYRRSVQSLRPSRMIEHGITASFSDGRYLFLIEGRVNWELSIATIRKLHTLLDRIVKAEDAEDEAYERLDGEYEIAPDD